MGTSREGLTFIVNPLAGSGRGLKVWRRLEAQRPDLRQHQSIVAQTPHDARAQIESALANGAQRLVAIGGDGTAHLAVNTILDLGFGDDVSLGFIPAGTGSDLARSLEIARDPLIGVQQAVDGVERRIDLLEISALEATDSRWAVNTISTGLSGVIATRANLQPKTGPLTYLRLLLQCYFGYSPPTFSVAVDGQSVFTGPVLLLAIANGRFFGQGMPVAPDARIDDGFFDLIIIPPVPLWRIPWFLTRFLTGRHTSIPFVQTHRGRELDLRAATNPTPYEIDGETLPPSPATIRLIPRALSVVAPGSRG